MKKLIHCEVEGILVHHSASNHLPSEDVTATIRRWHLERGFLDIGYQYIIDQQGKTHEGRSLEFQGAHCKGFNDKWIGICVAGNGLYFPRQYVALGRLHQKLNDQFKRYLPMKPHHALADTKCPPFQLNWDD